MDSKSLNNPLLKSVVLGCGDVGKRLVRVLLEDGHPAKAIVGFVNSDTSMDACHDLGIVAHKIDFDQSVDNLGLCHQAQVYYTVAPQKQGLKDLRSYAVLNSFSQNSIKPAKIVLISTTGVYGDCDGQWVTELSPVQPATDRGQRRLNSEQQWLTWGQVNKVEVVVLRVPGIYALSRLPRERIAKRIPVVSPDECGFTNRIHADDLAQICNIAMQKAKGGEVFNATDGCPGKISEYLQAAAKVLAYEPLPEISMEQAKTELSAGMLSYLSESRKISNQKMLDELGVVLKYPDFRQGIQK